ncbi:hypothetical protein NAL19_1085 [Pectobacterium sp. F1-1]|nr:hypothetical protein NAL19_1085 [Pectobacterium sp. F1-1]
MFLFLLDFNIDLLPLIPFGVFFYIMAWLNILSIFSGFKINGCGGMLSHSSFIFLCRYG